MQWTHMVRMWFHHRWTACLDLALEQHQRLHIGPAALDAYSALYCAVGTSGWHMQRCTLSEE